MPTAETTIQSIAPVTDRKFGVEIEFVGLAAQDAVQAISNIGVNINGQVVYSHADSQTHWKIVPDGSLSGMNTGELVSPILSGLAGLQEVERVVRALSAAGASVNRTCGLHVHCDAHDLDAAARLAIARRYAKYEAIIDQMMPASRRGNSNHYCASVVNYAHQASPTMFPRHLKVNLTAYDRHRSIEFRHHAGTVNADKICNWIRFCVNYVERSKERVAELVRAVAPTGDYPGRRSVTRNASAPIGARALRNYRLIVELLRRESMSGRILAEQVGVSQASITVMISHLRTRYGFTIRKTRWNNTYRLVGMGTLPETVIRGGRRAARNRPDWATEAARNYVAAAIATSNLPADDLFLGLDPRTIGFYEGRRAALSNEDSAAA